MSVLRRGSAFVWYKIVHMFLQHLTPAQIRPDSVLFQCLQLSGQSHFFAETSIADLKHVRFGRGLVRWNPRRVT